MFESLDDQMKHDQERESTPRQRMVKWAGVVFAATAVFGGLYYAIQTLA